MDQDLIIRRLLIAKEFHQHAVDRSLMTDPINKMMAIHNFHIAVEITLKCILLKNEIRAEKTINIDFEAMMSEVDKNVSPKLMYRQELRSLNQLRGLIQHQGLEPAQSSLEEFRVVSRKFLEFSYNAYFDVEFGRLSRLSLINDLKLQNLLQIAHSLAGDGFFAQSAVRSIVAFKHALAALAGFLPGEGLNSSFFVRARLGGNGINLEPIAQGFDSVFRRIRKTEQFAAILATGVQLSDFQRFQSIPIYVDFSISGSALVQKGARDVSQEEAFWAIEFAIACILLWQHKGLKPAVGDWAEDGVAALINPSELHQNEPPPAQ